MSRVDIEWAIVVLANVGGVPRSGVLRSHTWCAATGTRRRHTPVGYRHTVSFSTRTNTSQHASADTTFAHHGTLLSRGWFATESPPGGVYQNLPAGRQDGPPVNGPHPGIGGRVRPERQAIVVPVGAGCPFRRSTIWAPGGGGPPGTGHRATDPSSGAFERDRECNAETIVGRLLVRRDDVESLQFTVTPQLTAPPGVVGQRQPGMVAASRIQFASSGAATSSSEPSFTYRTRSTSPNGGGSSKSAPPWNRTFAVL